MISSVLVPALFLLAANDPNLARKSYRQCLDSFIQASSAKKLKLEDFNTGLGPACTQQEQAFRRASVAFDISRGISRRTSEEGVNDEIADLMSSAKTRYQFSVESTQAPPK